MNSLNFPQKHQGFAILLAILLVSIVLTIGLTLFNITYRQLLLSSLAKESQYAFYASDSAMHCARYYDNLSDPTQRPFGHVSSDGNTVQFTPSGGGSIDCGAGPVEVAEALGAGASPAVYTFILAFPQVDRDPVCAQVTVTKYRDPSVTTPPGEGAPPDAPQIFGRTKITARGYNNYRGELIAPCHLDNDRTVERASELLY